MDVQGQYQAITAALAMHHVGHAHARVEHGVPDRPAGLEVIRRESKAAAAPSGAGAAVTDPALEIKPVVRILRELAEERPDAAGDHLRRRDDHPRPSWRRGRTVWRARMPSLGVGFGDFVTIGLPNSIEFYVVMLAAWKVGAVPQPVSYRLPAAERAAIIDLADSKLVVGVPEGEHPGRLTCPRATSPTPRSRTAALPEVVSPALRAPTSGGSTGRPKLIVTGSAAEGRRRRRASSS